MMLYDKLLSKNKALEIDLAAQWCKPYFCLDARVKISRDWTGVDVNVFGILDIAIYRTQKQDHAGFYFSIDTFFGWFNFNIYDIRHWNYDTDNWEVYDDQK